MLKHIFTIHVVKRMLGALRLLVTQSVCNMMHNYVVDLEFRAYSARMILSNSSSSGSELFVVVTRIMLAKLNF